jgi:DNA mismatch repair protein MSH5
MELEEDIYDHKNILAIHWSDKRMGFSCYSELTNSIRVDSAEISNKDLESIVTSIKSACTPSIIILHPKIINNKELLDIIISNTDDITNTGTYRYQTIKSSCWNFESAIEVITNKLVVKDSKSKSNNDYFSSNENYILMSSLIDMTDKCAIQSLGALISFMQMSLFNMDEGWIKIASISDFRLESYLRIDSGSLSALQIFCEEVHPNVIKGVGRSKEGFSVFGLFDRTQSIPGRRRLR